MKIFKLKNKFTFDFLHFVFWTNIIHNFFSINDFLNKLHSHIYYEEVYLQKKLQKFNIDKKRKGEKNMKTLIIIM